MKKDTILLLTLSFLAIVSLLLTFVRNKIYRTDLILWEDCAKKNEWNDIRSMVGYAKALQDENNFEKAIKVLEKASEVDYSKYRFSKANLKFLIGRYAVVFPFKVARELNEFIFEIDSSDYQSLAYLAWSYFREGDIENARIAASLLNRSFLYPDARSIMGDIYSYYGCYEKAEREYLKAIELEPNNPRWGKKLIENAIRYHPSDKIENLLKEQSSYLSENTLEIYYDFLSGKTEGDLLELFNLALYYFQNGNFIQSVECINILLKQNAGTIATEHLINISEMFAKLRDYDKAYDLLIAAKNKDKDEFDILVILAGLCKKSGKLEESIQWYDRALEKTKNDRMIYILERKKKIVQRLIRNGNI